MNQATHAAQTGWVSTLAKICFFALLFEGVTGFAITLVPFHAAVQWGVLAHTIVGLLTLLPVVWYAYVHWDDYRGYAMSHVVLLGYVGVLALLVCAVSGVVVTWQGLFATRMSGLWRQVHLISSIVVVVGSLPHLAIALGRALRDARAPHAGRFVWQSSGVAAVGLVLTVAMVGLYGGTVYVNAFPDDYNFPYGEDRPFAPSLARTASGGAFDPRSLAGSETCGSSGCHEQILAEWKPSAHRYSAMDPAFQKIQSVMAEQNGPESTRYCGGCHDPISLFSGTKNVFVEDLTGLQGYQEGISCLVCHAIRETDIQGNANYTVSQPDEYLWQWADGGSRKLLRDFLIRTYPDEHNRLSKRAYKAPEYCAACHKQFIDQEVNRVGWVQLQNQYDNWANSRWNHKGDPSKTIECRECHMPLVDSHDPAAGDTGDYNRSADDGKHRSHRFIAANSMIPPILKLEGWEQQVELTREWLQGDLEIPEIRDKWASGPVVGLALDVPESVVPGEKIPIRVILTSNKVGHDFPTGPLDIIQSWVELHVVDENGRTVYSSGTRDEKHFIEPGSFLFKAEPVDQYGNLIDRHNLWEMVGVRYRRALFPGYSDTVEYSVDCPSSLVPAGEAPATRGDDARSVREVDLPAAASPGTLEIVAVLHYRKVDQFLLNYLFGEDSGLTAPVIELDRATATVRVADRVARGAAAGAEAGAAPHGGS